MTSESAPAGAFWVPEVLERPDGDVPFERFVHGLSEAKATALKAAIDRVLTVRGIALVRTEWLKPLGGGLHEFRLRHDAHEIMHMFGRGPSAPKRSAGGIVLRLFVHFHGQRRVLLLNGYDKAADPSKRRQRMETAFARRLLAEFKAGVH